MEKKWTFEIINLNFKFYLKVIISKIPREIKFLKKITLQIKVKFHVLNLLPKQETSQILEH